MLPIFNDYIKFLNNYNIPIKLKEGYYWINNNIIKCFINGKLKKLCRLKIDDELNISFLLYKDFNEKDLKNVESWKDTYKNFENQIILKEKESLSVIKDTINTYNNYKYILTTSTGKDSQIVDYLLNKLNINYEKIFNNTTMDAYDTYIMAKQDKNIKIITPKSNDGNYLSFYKMIEKFGLPSRFHRWCCDIFKEQETNKLFQNIDNVLFFNGIRNEESFARSEYNFIRQNDKYNNKTHLFCLPIKNWNEIEVWLYTIHNNIIINPKYKKGYTRVGCHIACPYYTKSTWILDKFWYECQFEKFHKILEKDFIKNEKWYRLNCTLKEYHYNWSGGLVRKEPNNEVINEFMKYKGLNDKNIALKYFNKECCNCKDKNGKPKKIFRKNEIAMNLKLLGRNIEKFMCKKCLIKYLNIDEEKWNQMIQDFKSQNCKLF